jgi:hypothetical protein
MHEHEFVIVNLIFVYAIECIKENVLVIIWAAHFGDGHIISKLNGIPIEYVGAIDTVTSG